jgi:hypothetical protein
MLATPNLCLLTEKDKKLVGREKIGCGLETRST